MFITRVFHAHVTTDLGHALLTWVTAGSKRFDQSRTCFRFGRKHANTVYNIQAAWFGQFWAGI
jgi:hypothetical protein